MIKKRETCLYCGEKMESETAKKRFCSDKCRVYWKRENSNLKFKKSTQESFDGRKSQKVFFDEVGQWQEPDKIKINKEKMPLGLSLSEQIEWRLNH